MSKMSKCRGKSLSYKTTDKAVKMSSDPRMLYCSSTSQRCKERWRNLPALDSNYNNARKLTRSRSPVWNLRSETRNRSCRRLLLNIRSITMNRKWGCRSILGLLPLPRIGNGRIAWISPATICQWPLIWRRKR